MDKILVTGINGVIGKILANSLADSFDIYGVDHEVSPLTGKIFKADISDYDEIAHVIDAISALRTIVHLAADSHGGNLLFPSSVIATSYSGKRQCFEN